VAKGEEDQQNTEGKERKRRNPLWEVVSHKEDELISPKREDAFGKKRKKNP